ncbi:MAG: hypothetical protein H6618_02790 [Deltaproteobacteria bacterium]|nr:hypothetical protein [Deltaproteobacteria bacterium]
MIRRLKRLLPVMILAYAGMYPYLASILYRKISQHGLTTQADYPYFDMHRDARSLILQISEQTDRMLCDPREIFPLKFTVTNHSDSSLSSGTEERPGKGAPVNIAYRLFLPDGSLLTESRRTFFSPPALHGQYLAPENSREVTLLVTCPEPGEYQLEAEAVQEGVAWQSDITGRELSIRIRIHARNPEESDPDRSESL